MEVVVCGGYCLGECSCVGAEPIAFPWLRDCDAPGYLDRACSSSCIQATLLEQR